MLRPLPIVAAAAAVMGALMWRTRHLRAVERRCMERRAMGAGGIVVGGEGFELPREGAAGVLLIHGGGDTPQTLRYLATHLHERGFAVSAPLLPGHGRTLRAFTRVSANELLDATRQHYQSMRARSDWVGVVGLSMGAALAVQLAAEQPALPALGLVAPYLAMPERIARAARLAWLWGPVVPVFNSSDGVSILDPVEQARNLAYGAFSANALAALYEIVQCARTALARVAAPTLMIQSRTDNRISVDAAERAFALLGAREKRLVWVTGAAHIITVDYGRDQVIAHLGDWMTAHRDARSTA